MNRIPTKTSTLLAWKNSGVPIGSILDVGVLYGTPALMQAFPDIPHVLYEPVLEYHSYISKEYAQIDHQIVAAAASDVTGEARLKSVKHYDHPHPTHSYIVDNLDEAEGIRSVPVLRLDNHVPTLNIPKPYLLKVDVEGADIPGRILRGAKNIYNDVALVIVEMTVPKFAERAAILNESGFVIWDIVDLCYYKNNLWQFDAVFVNESIRREMNSLRPMESGPLDIADWHELSKALE